jgi:hypothetical protein
MKTFDVQSIEVNATYERTVAFIADPGNLPRWAHAFQAVSNGRARLWTPNGSVDVGLITTASREHGTVDWELTFPDGSAARACSRVIELRPDQCVYSFVLMPPPVSLEQLEGTLQQQSEILKAELMQLRRILEESCHAAGEGKAAGQAVTYTLIGETEDATNQSNRSSVGKRKGQGAS